MSNPKLGQLIVTEECRDAIHVAVAPVVAGERLMPGDHVGFLEDGRVGEGATTKLGVVDPFLRVSVRRGERFWLCLYPSTVTSLRHDWEHPAFSGKAAPSPTRAESEEWLTDFASRLGFSYDNIMQAAAHYAQDNSICMGNDLTYWPEEEEMALFRKHYAVVSGKESTAEHFRCAC